MADQKHILISNDDGIDAPGLKILEETLARMPQFRVTVVAPHDQQSASSHALTLTSPLRILDAGPGRYAVTGTPTDSVLVAMEKILADDKPDYVLSGINHGPNMGEDVIYSGTVAAAMEGTMFGIPSYALSLAKWHPTDFSGAAEFLRLNLEKILAFPLRKGTLLNINLPKGPWTPSTAFASPSWAAGCTRTSSPIRSIPTANPTSGSAARVPPGPTTKVRTTTPPWTATSASRPSWSI